MVFVMENPIKTQARWIVSVGKSQQMEDDLGVARLDSGLGQAHQATERGSHVQTDPHRAG